MPSVFDIIDKTPAQASPEEKRTLPPGTKKRSVFDLIEEEQEVPTRPTTREKPSLAKEIPTQAALGAVEGGLGSLGNLVELSGLNPGKASDPVARKLTSGRIATREDIAQVLKDLGAPEATSSAGKITRKATTEGAGAATLGVGAAQSALATAGGATGESIREAGGPEWLAEAADVGVNLGGLFKNLPALFKKEVQKGASGLTQRKFENVTKPTKVLPSTKEAIGEKVGKEFKDISEDILQSTNKSLKNYRVDPAFQSKLAEGYESMKSSGANIPKTVSGNPYKKALAKESAKIGGEGFELSEAERTAKRELNKSIQGIQKKELTFNDLVDQYQKNNEQLGKYLPYGPDAVANEGKREALLAKNRAIKNIIGKDFQDYPEAKEFEFLNKQWSEVQKIKTVDSFVDSVFTKEGINFKEADKILSGGKKAKNLENAVGKEQFQRFKQLNKDLLTKEQAYKLLESKGYNTKDLVKLGALGILKPIYAAVYGGAGLIKRLWKTGLSNPKVTREWGDAVKLFKKGNIEEAIAVMNTLEKQHAVKDPEEQGD